MEVPDTAWVDVRVLWEPQGSFKNLFFTVGHQNPLKRIRPMGGSFWAPGPPKLTFVESKRCQFLSILSMGQDGVLKKPNLTNLAN